ncbi:MAG: S-methyl-5-thioribose-1-phosphate isomerase [Theionarchaea archaeon]|nr:S-methyl-5-thioribose-1-phosphate isomerase [Theionarchaea archaeon]
MTIWWDEQEKTVNLIDQTLLPDELKIIRCSDWKRIRDAIQILSIRGAPALGAAGAYALALEAQRYDGNEKGFFETMERVKEIAKARPTAVNLEWGVRKVYDALQASRGVGVSQLKEIALRTAHTIVEEDIAANRMIGVHGLQIFTCIPRSGIEYRILTHCHAGSLATCGYGTVFGVIRGAVENKIPLRVFSDETRPLLQGARITAWELHIEQIPVVLLPDDAAGWVMKSDRIDMVVVGADRIAANGDTANKIGTYSLSILAKEHDIPFYIAAPLSTIDLETKAGSDIPIEERDYREVTCVRNLKIATYLREDQVKNYAFDVTPHEHITGIITERGIITEPYGENILSMFR